MYALIRARLSQFIYFKSGGSPCKFYGGGGFSSMFLRKMDFIANQTHFSSAKHFGYLIN